MADISATPTTFIPKKVYYGQLASSNAELYAVPADKAFKVCSIILVNDTTTGVTATLYFCDNSDAAADAHLVCKEMTIPGDGCPVILDFGPHGFYLNATDTIEGFASAATQVTCHISGVLES